VDLALGWGPCLPNGLAAGEELQPEEESLVSRARGILNRRAPLPLNSVQSARSEDNRQ
jgi:hypothetical protein